MSVSMKYLFAVAVAAGAFEALSAVWLNAPDVVGQLLAGAFAAGLLLCAWAMRSRRSLGAASVIAVLLLLDVAGIPFYSRTSVSDWVVQLTFGLVGLVGLAAWVHLFRTRPHRLVAQG